MQNITDSSPHLVDEDRGPAVLSVTIIFTVISFVFVFLRVVSRCFIVGRWKWDDWFIVFSWLLALGFSFSICWGVKNGLGRHSEYISALSELPLRKCEYVFSILYNPVLMCTKTSICIFYLTVAKNQQFFRWGVYATLAVVNCAGFALTLVNILQCHPPSALVQQNIPDSAVCIDIVAIYLASAPVNIITDLALLLLPMPMLTAMRMPKKQKIILIVTFGFGLFVSVVDVVRIYYLQEAFQARVSDVSRGNAITSQLLDQDDFPWYAAYSFMWSAVEVHVGIMCASVPALKPLVAKIMPTMLYDTSSQIDNATWRRKGRRNLLKSCLCGLIGPETATSRTAIGTKRYYGDGDTSPHASEEKRSGSGMPLKITPTPLELPALENVRSRDFASGSENLDSPSEERKRASTMSGQDVLSMDGALTESLGRTDSPNSRHTGQDGGSDGASVGGAGGNGDADHPMDFMEFLTTPDMPNTLTRQATFGTTATLPPTPDPTATFFDFYQISGKKTMTELTGRESIIPISAVTILFFLWGFAYGLLEQLNAQFAHVSHLNTIQTVALHSSYFAAYLISVPTIGQLCLRKAGFRMTFICGLCIYSAGTLIFWPSAVLVSYPAFLLSNIICGAGVGILEVAADPFVALCGPLRYSEARLCLSQAVQAVGTVLSPLLAQKVLFVDVKTTESLIDAQWTYLAIALFDVALAVVFYYLPIPEAEDGDFETIRLRSLPEGQRISEDDRKISRSAYITLGVAVFSMFTYVGAQEVVSTEYQLYITEVDALTDHLRAFDWQLLGYATFAIGRFLASGLSLVMPPYILLGICYLGVIITSAISLGVEGTAGGSMLVLYELFQGPIFPLIYAIGLRGLGKNTKWGAVALTSAISGGAVWPILSAGVNAVRSPQISLSVAVGGVAIGLIHPLYIGLYSPARRQVDPNLGIGGTLDLKAKSKERQQRKSRSQRRAAQRDKQLERGKGNSSADEQGNSQALAALEAG